MSNPRPSMTSTLNEKRNELLKMLTSSFSTTGLATEATQLLVLSTLQSLFAEQKIDFELKCVEDANGDIFQLRISVDEPSGVYTIDYIDATGAVATPVAPVQFCNPNALLNSILTELTTLNTTDFATAANQALAIAELQNIVTNTADVATETTLAAFLAAFSATDFATETTLDAQASDVAKLVGFAIGEYDEIDITYIAAGNGVGEVGTVVYSLAAAPVATLTLTYDASNRLINVTKS